MGTCNTLDVLKQCFEEVVPTDDNRTTIAPLSFVVCLVYTYLGDSKTFSLEAIRRGMIRHLKTRISRSAFWERVSAQTPADAVEWRRGEADGHSDDLRLNWGTAVSAVRGEQH